MKVVTLPGDGVGPEVMREAIKVLNEVAPSLSLAEHPIGGRALAEAGSPLPEDTLSACQEADAVLMGAVGTNSLGADDDGVEEGMFRLRKELGVYANLRPFATGEIDLLIVRELLGGLYYGSRGVRPDGTVYDTCEYHPDEVERVVRKAFELARVRRQSLVSVDKANVLACSRMWRSVVEEVARDYPEVQVGSLLVDTAAMRLVEQPERFDVVVTENTFGDILSDVAAAVSGGLGAAPSASVGTGGPGLFEPVHGSAPDIAGLGVANPTGMIRSAAMMLELGVGLPSEARLVDDAVVHALQTVPTRDLGGVSTTAEFGDVVADYVSRRIEVVWSEGDPS
jgi:3-isopropylmalate dehydrogenase